MIKLSANLSKKVPMPDVEFSSQQYGAAMEIEVSDAADAQEITGRLQSIYGLLEKSIDQQIQTASRSQTPAAPRRSFLGENNKGNGGNGHDEEKADFRRNGKATPAQIKAIFAVCKDRSVTRDELIKLIQGEFNVSKPDDLSVKSASDLIGRLQKMQGAQR